MVVQTGKKVMQSRILEHKLLATVVLVVALTSIFVLTSSKPASAQSCFDSAAERNSALPIQANFPRGQLTRRRGDCVQQSHADSWSLASSFYYNSPSNQSSLQTGRVRFETFYNGASSLPNAQTVLVGWNGRCEYSGRAQVWADDPVSGSYLLGELENPGGVTVIRAYNFNARWQAGGAKYGPNVYRAGTVIRIQVADYAGSEMSCRVRVHNLSGARMSFFADSDSSVAYSEPSQQTNWYNWRSRTKYFMGPKNNSGAYALYSGWRNGDGSSPYLEYALPFGTACDVTTPRRTYLRIYDMDHPVNGVFGPASPGPKQGERPYMRLYDETTNSVVPVTGLPASGEVNISNDEYGEYYFTAQPGHRYTWVFWNILASNGVQVWMPFSEVHASYGCPTWDHDPRIQGVGAGTQAAPGSVGAGGTVQVRPLNYNVGSGTSQNYDLRLRPLDATTRQWVTATNAAGGSLSNAGAEEYRWVRPGLGAGGGWAPGYTSWRVDNNAPHGTVLCFEALVRANSASNPNWEVIPSAERRCWRVTRLTYSYTPSSPTTFNSLPRYYAGTSFGVTGNVRNANTSTTGTGPAYREYFIVSDTSISGSSTYTSPALGGLARNGVRTHSTANNRWTIRSDAPHNRSISCANRVSPAAGLAAPSPNVTTLSDRTTTRTTCFRVYNLRYNIAPLTPSDVTFSSSSVLPTSNFTVDADVCNTDAIPTGSTGGVAPSVRVRVVADTNVSGATVDRTVNISRGAGGCFDVPAFSGTVNATAGLGDVACVRVLISKDRGFSDDYQTTGSQNYRQCVNVAEQAYVDVRENGIWAGGDFDPSTDGYGTPWCAPTGSAYIRGARLGSLGSYARYIVGSTGPARNWGSFTRTGTRLAFANTPSLGNFNANGLCFHNLDTYLSRDTSLPGVRNLPASPAAYQNTSGQFIGPNNSNYNFGAAALTISEGTQVTIIIDGDVTINRNIEFEDYTTNNKDDIPSFIVVATGDININGAVTRLDGIYYAGGVIDDCSNATGNLSSSSCVNQLVVNGIFTAEDIELKRTYGGISGTNPNGGNQPAEIFNTSADFFIADHFMVSTFEPELEIEQLIDLPPAIN